MALILDKSTIVSLGTIRPWHVSQSVDAFTGLEAYDITISGSLTVTGSVYLDQLSDTPQNDVLSFDSVTKQVFYTSSQGLLANAPNFANTDLTLTAGRTHYTDNNQLWITSNTSSLFLGQYMYFPAPSVIMGNSITQSYLGVKDNFILFQNLNTSDTVAIYVQNTSSILLGPTAIELNNSKEDQDIIINGTDVSSPILFTDAANNRLAINKNGLLTPNTTVDISGSTTMSGSLTVTGSVFFRGLSDTAQSNVLTLNTTTGQLYYTASSALGGGGGGYTTVENEGSPLTQRTTIDFVGAGVTAADIGGKTVVTITGASGSLAAAGNNYEIQYNSGSELAAIESFRFNYLSQSLEQGAYVTASGLVSHAEGAFTLAQGAADHAEGYFTTASSVGWGGDPAAAHAEGTFTKAFGAGSHTEGSFTMTSASSAHAEGVSTLVTGPGSHAEGYFTTASGQDLIGGNTGGAHSEGLLTFASASFSHAEGRNTISKGVFSHAEGSGSIAEGAASHAEGRQTLASGLFSHTEGYLTTASGIYSHAEGLGTVSSNTGSHAYGLVSLASGEFSFAGGIYSTASGDYSVALGMSSSAATIGTFAAGVGTKADLSVLTAFGTYNQTSSISNTSYGTFVVGGGVSDSARANLFRVSGSGQCLAAGTFTNGGADYAEYFESYDGQSIPLGTVVELTGSHIKICEIAENAIGVISNKPSILGNSDEGTGDEWTGKYEKDIWGNYIMEEYDYQIVSHVDEDMNVTYKTLTGTRKKLNPNFNPALQYTPREQRPEWNVVGLLGQIRVLKNQQIPSRWIKMKDLNDEIAIYLIK